MNIFVAGVITLLWVIAVIYVTWKLFSIMSRKTPAKTVLTTRQAIMLLENSEVENKIIEYIKKNGDEEILDMEAFPRINVIAAAFIWEDTEEGSEYWETQNLILNEKLNKYYAE